MHQTLLVLFSLVGFAGLTILVDTNNLSVQTTDFLRPYTLDIDHHDVYFKHNFCESKLQNDKPPESGMHIRRLLYRLCLSFIVSPRTPFFTMLRVC